MISAQSQASLVTSNSLTGIEAASGRPNVVSLKRNSLKRFAAMEQQSPLSALDLPNELFPESVKLANCSSNLGLAKGILRQTAHDLRRFDRARTPRQRELYADAYTWLIANEFSWPCSFLNICHTLGLEPEQTRAELLAAAKASWPTHALTLARHAAESLHTHLHFQRATT